MQITVGLYAAPKDKEFFDFMVEKAPEDVKVVLVDRTASFERQAAMCNEIDIIVPFHARTTMELIHKCPKLKLMQVMGAGTDYLDKPALAELGVQVANSGGANSVAVSEHTVMLMMMTYRKARHQIADVLAGKWADRIRAEYSIREFHEISGKTVGIVAAGNIGRNVARRLQGWECKLLYTDVIKVPDQVERELHLTRVSLDEILQISDIVTLHVPLTPATHGLIGQRELNMMKPSAILINACRGPVVDEKALYEALKSRRILGAGLDVTEEEPTPVDNPLFTLDNVVITPHLAGYTVEWYLKGLLAALDNATRMAQGQPILNLVPVDA